MSLARTNRFSFAGTLSSNCSTHGISPTIKALRATIVDRQIHRLKAAMTPTTLTTMKIQNLRAVGRNGGKSHLLYGRQGVSHYYRVWSFFLPPTNFPSSHKASKRPSPAVVSYLSTDDDDSEEEYGAKRGPKKLKNKNKNKKKPNRQKVVVDFDEPAEVRFSTRRAAKITSYNEDDDEDEEEEDEAFIQKVYREEDNATGIDLVLDHRPKGNLGKWKNIPSLHW